MQMDSMIRIATAQQRIFRCIEDELREDGHHKSYEGSMEVTLSLPNFFEPGAPKWTISLHCYLLIDGRHEHWTGRSLDEAVAQMEAAIAKICFPYEMRRFERDMGINVDDENEREGGTTYGPGRAQEHEGPF